LKKKILNGNKISIWFSYIKSLLINKRDEIYNRITMPAANEMLVLLEKLPVDIKIVKGTAISTANKINK
jgi:hypothetical protein